MKKRWIKIFNAHNKSWSILGQQSTWTSSTYSQPHQSARTNAARAGRPAQEMCGSSQCRWVRVREGESWSSSHYCLCIASVAMFAFWRYSKPVSTSSSVHHPMIFPSLPRSRSHLLETLHFSSTGLMSTCSLFSILTWSIQSVHLIWSHTHTPLTYPICLLPSGMGLHRNSLEELYLFLKEKVASGEELQVSRLTREIVRRGEKRRGEERKIKENKGK